MFLSQIPPREDSGDEEEEEEEGPEMEEPGPSEEQAGPSSQNQTSTSTFREPRPSKKSGRKLAKERREVADVISQFLEASQRDRKEASEQVIKKKKIISDIIFPGFQH